MLAEKTIIEVTENKARPTPFDGFDQRRFVMIPSNFLEYCMQTLTGSELLVILYIFRRTLGYCDRAGGGGGRKTADAISRSQFLDGIRRADGTILDRGAGVSERSLNRALAGLEARGYITRHHHTTATGRPATTVYRLVMREEASGDQEPAVGAPGSKTKSQSQSQITTQPTPANLPPIPTRPTNDVIRHQIEKPACSEATATQANLPQPPVASHQLTGQAQLESELAARSASLTAKMHPTNPGKMPDTKESLKQKKNFKQQTQQTQEAEIRGQRLDVSKSVCEEREHLDEMPGRIKPVSPGQTDVGESFPVKPVVDKPVSARFEAVVEELLNAHISRQEAQTLAAQAVENGHGPGYIGLVLGYIDRQPQVKSREGFLIHLVRTNWQPSPHSTTSTAAPTGPVSSGTGQPFSQQHDISQASDPRIADVKLPVTPNMALLSRQIELERANLAQATTERQRLIAQARLERYALFEELIARDGRVEIAALAELVYQQRQQQQQRAVSSQQDNPAGSSSPPPLPGQSYYAQGQSSAFVNNNNNNPSRQSQEACNVAAV